jgi:hypothetical protein
VARVPALRDSPLDHAVKRVEEPVNVGRLCGIYNDHQGGIIKAGLGAGYHCWPSCRRGSSLAKARFTPNSRNLPRAFASNSRSPAHRAASIIATSVAGSFRGSLSVLSVIVLTP